MKVSPSHLPTEYPYHAGSGSFGSASAVGPDRTPGVVVLHVLQHPVRRLNELKGPQISLPTNREDNPAARTAKPDRCSIQARRPLGRSSLCWNQISPCPNPSSAEAWCLTSSAAGFFCPWYPSTCRSASASQNNRASSVWTIRRKDRAD